MPIQIKKGIKQNPEPEQSSVTHYISNCHHCGEITKWMPEELKNHFHSKVRGCHPYPYDVRCPNCGKTIIAEPRFN